MQHCRFGFTVRVILTNMQKKECPVCSFPYLKVREKGERIRVGWKEYMQQTWIQYRMENCRRGYLRGMSGINKALYIITES